jgi:hypothetical protein
MRPLDIRGEEWDPRLLQKFREKWGFTKSDMMRLLSKRGLDKLTFATYQRWESGTIPRPLYRDAIVRVLRDLGSRLEEEKKAKRAK